LWKKNSSENPCQYEADIIIRGTDKLIFTGVKKFTVKPKDTYIYELRFEPASEEKFEGELKLQNITEGITSKYFLSGKGEKAPPLTDLNIETRVGES
jgi:hypothetical protein